MSFVLKILALLVKCFLLFVIISFERVIGLPVFFLTVTISFFLLSRSRTRYFLFTFATVLLAVFYQQAFVLSFLLLIFVYLGFVLGARLIESNIQRFLLLLIISILIIGIVSDIQFSVWAIVQLLLGVLISALFLIKYLFVRYGFIGKEYRSS